MTMPPYEEVHAPPDFDGAEGLLAIIIRNWYVAEQGVHFFTDPNLPQQLACIRHPPGHQVHPHVHRDVPRQISRTQEVLIIRKGIARLDLFTSAGVPVRQCHLIEGDVVMLISGGHGITVSGTQDLEILEIKQGPYAGAAEDKRWLTPKVRVDG